MRIDKFMKVSRLIKRRTVANEVADAGRITVNGKPVKASYAAVSYTHLPREQRVAAEQQTAAQQADGPGAVAGRGDDAEREIRVHADFLSVRIGVVRRGERKKLAAARVLRGQPDLRTRFPLQFLHCAHTVSYTHLRTCPAAVGTHCGKA